MMPLSLVTLYWTVNPSSGAMYLLNPQYSPDPSSSRSDFILQVGVQNEIIDDLGDEMDATNAHLLSTTRRVQSVGNASGKVWKYWAIIVLLLIVIIILVAI